MERPASSTLPTTPGIYIYKDAQGRIIYVGKARNLRKRILSYFRDASALTPKTVAMIGLSLIHISSPRDQRGSRMPSSA